ncbi:MAG TPA: hypothetical protein VF510_23360 [Ktedonobacterales bacterium]
MAHTIALSDEDYATLASASAHSGESIAELLHEAIAAFCAPPQPSAIYQDPTGEPLSQDESDEMGRAADEIGSEKPLLSDTVFEDSGPR